MRSGLPSEIATAIDWDALRRLDAAFVDEELRDHQADLVFATTADGSDVVLHLLLEHKSYDDHFAALQMLRYTLKIWDRWRDEHPGTKTLPQVVCYVLYHGDKPWRGPHSLRQLMQTGGPAAIEAMQPEFQFVLDDLSGSSAETLTLRALAVDALLPLLHLQFVQRAASCAATLLGWRSLYQELRRTPGGQAVLKQLFCYIAVVGNDQENVRGAYAAMDQIDEEDYLSIAEQLALEGHQRGIAKVLAKLLAQKFGSIGADASERVRTASIEELELWSTRVLVAASPDEVMAP